MSVNPHDGSFDDLAGDYARYRMGYSPDLIDTLFGLGFASGMHVLDVGCGTGLAAEPLVARGCRVTGVDPSAEMLAAARARVPAATFREGRAEQLPFDGDAFDGAISAQTFHWFDQPAAFRELTRVVKRGGPVAVWWKMLAADDDMRTFRRTASAAVGMTPHVDALAGGFRAFYGAPFARRELRVVPFVARYTVDEWLGYERSRANLRNQYGTRAAAYLDALERALRETFAGAGARFDVRYTQYLYVGYAA